MPRIRKMNILAIGSHPDDIEFGCGGTIHKLTRESNRVYLLLMTDGSFGGDPKRRRTEQEKAARCMGAQDIFWAGFDDTRLPQNQPAIQAIEAVIKTVKPTFVFVHHGNDTHQDHRHTCENTVVASRNVANVLFYEGPTTIDFSPSVYVDIGDHMKTKVDCLTCHASQVNRTNVRTQSILDIARATAMFRGTQCRAPYAEGFVPLRMFIML